jgi:hypothetical protein
VPAQIRQNASSNPLKKIAYLRAITDIPPHNEMFYKYMAHYRFPTSPSLT